MLPQAFNIFNLVNDTVLLSSKQPFRFADDMPGNDYPLMRIPFEQLTAGEREELWIMMLDGAMDDVAHDALEVLAGQFSLTSGQVVAAASTAMSQALQEGRTLQNADLFEAARIHSGHHLGELAQKIQPRYQVGVTWYCLKRRLTCWANWFSMVKTRSQVLEEWGLGP